MEGFLTSCGLQKYIDKFKQENITFSVLQLMNNNDMAELIPSLGDRINFRTSLEKIKHENLDISAIENTSIPNVDEINLDEMNVLEPCNSSTSTVILGKDFVFPDDIEISEDDGPPLERSNAFFVVDHHVTDSSSLEKKFQPSLVADTSQKRNSSEASTEANSSQSKRQCIEHLNASATHGKFVGDITLKEFLLKSRTGQVILQSQEINGYLDVADRNNLKELVVNGVMERYGNVSGRMFESLAEEIVTLFPKEKKEIYFTYNKLKSKNIGGKLMNVYKNKRAYHRKHLKSKESDDQTPQVTITADIETMIKWLKHSHKPWQQVLSYWLKTFNVRKADYNSVMNCSSLLEKWPIIKHSDGYTLVSLFLG